MKIEVVPSDTHEKVLRCRDEAAGYHGIIALHSTVRDAFAKHHVACLIADWTSRNPEITKLLEEHGRDGVPLYLYYAPGAADAKILPQILTADDVVKAVGS